MLCVQRMKLILLDWLIATPFVVGWDHTVDDSLYEYYIMHSQSQVTIYLLAANTQVSI